MPTDATFLLAALFIVFGALGLVYKIYSDRDRDLPPHISADYIRGLNLVLNRRTDEALELFVQMAKVDDDTLETHFALGHLFRRRGEIERAIRVHENLLARPNLNEAQRHQALFSLAEDYLNAGLFDRAEKLFAELRESTTLADAALDKLVSIYEREQEWQKAIDAHRKLEMLRGSKSSQVAHYYCELAELARAAGDRALAREHLRNTVRSESGALRGTLIRATLAREEQDYAQAIPLYEQVLAADRHFITEVLPPLLECYRAAEPAAGVRRLSRRRRRQGRFVLSRPRLRRDHRQLARLDRARERCGAVRVRAPRACQSRQRGRAARAACRAAQRCDRANRARAAHDRDGQRAVPLCELRLQHATVHLALPELQAVGDGAADSERAARNRARAPLTKLVEP